MINGTVFTDPLVGGVVPIRNFRIGDNPLRATWFNLTLIRMLSKFQVVLFFVYGVTLWLVAAYLAGFGHGSYLLFAITGAPFYYLFAPIGAFACLFQWGLLAMLLSGWRRAPAFVVGFLILHCVTAVLAVHLRLDPQDVDFGRLNSMLPHFNLYLSVGLAWYIGGQIVLWTIALKGVFVNWAASRNITGE